MRIYDEEEDDFLELAWSDVIFIEFEGGQSICSPKPNSDGKNWVYCDSTLLIRNKDMPLDLCQWLISVRFYNNYSMDNDMRLAAKYVRTRNLN